MESVNVSHMPKPDYKYELRAFYKFLCQSLSIVNRKS